MHAAPLGPANPNDRGGMSAAERTHWSGRAEAAHLSGFSFDEQYHTFQKVGKAADPDRAGVEVAAQPTEGGFAAAPAEEQAKKRQKTEKKKEAVAYDPSAPFVLASRQPWAEKESFVAPLTEEQREALAAAEEDKAEAAAVSGKGAETSVFHGTAERDYQGRPWTEAGPEARKAPEPCFLPKRHVHTWTGHTKPVKTVRFFPGTGHLLLSAGLEGKAKVWDVAGDKRCMRTYSGHTKGLTDAWWWPDGAAFATAGHDKVVKLWDTETGAVKGRFGEGVTAHTVRCHPDDPAVLLAGCGNKKIVQYDARTGDVVQEYDYHLGPVNTVTFIDGNRRFVSTSDDKSIRVWEFGIPVQVKYIADPGMHAIAAATTTPNGKWWLGQSADNQIVTYSADDRVKINRKKVFKGHETAGYAVAVGASHDDRYVISGDAHGKLFVWDWKNGRIVRSLKAHEGAATGVEWHPLESSKVATCGWDGLIKYWD
jgi:pre-mRNA-processing factor 17